MTSENLLRHISFIHFSIHAWSYYPQNEQVINILFTREALNKPKIGLCRCWLPRSLLSGTHVHTVRPDTSLLAPSIQWMIAHNLQTVFFFSLFAQPATWCQ